MQLGCGAFLQGFQEGMAKSQAPQKLLTRDKRLEITVPNTWKSDLSLNDKADLGAKYPSKEEYIILLDESKEDFEDMNLQKHSELTLGALQKNLGGSSQASEPEDLTINGLPARQVVVRGSSDGVKVVFLHTTVETDKSYCQVLAWTLSSDWDDNKADLQQVVKSLREVKPEKKAP